MRKKIMRFFCFPFSQKTISLLTIALLLLLTVPAFAFQQPDRTITGKVTDENKTPVAGVSVTLQGNRKSVMTDGDGHFEITVHANKSKLQFTAIGYVTREVTVGDQTTISVVLARQLKQLNDVVVTGYGKSSKKNITGSITHEIYAPGREPSCYRLSSPLPTYHSSPAYK